jgi:hypothetical protein
MRPETVHREDVWEVSRRGALGKSMVGVVSGKGTIFVGLDQPAADARELADLSARIAAGTSSTPISSAEEYPYSDFVAARAANEETIADSSEIDCVIGDYAYLFADADGHTPFVRIQPAAAAQA